MKLFYLLLAMAAIAQIQAVQYQVINNATGTPGGARFQNEIGIPYGQLTLQLASEFIWQTFQQGKDDRRNYDQVTMTVDNYTDSAPDFTLFNSILVSSDYIANYSGDVRIEVTGILYHETTHVWQWYGNGDTPHGLIEGLADYIRLKGGWAPMNWAQRGSGLRWDDGYEITAYFLEYCNGLKDGFVAELNAFMEYSYRDDFFVQLLGKSVDDLWNDYKSLYGN
ncbi:hypothetical protein ACOSP7_005129 [Xanthoceras sorbifolium]